LHIHFSEGTDSTSIDIVTIKDHSELNKYSQFSKDAFGNILKYRIIIKDNTVYRVLYNSGKSIDTVTHEGYEVK